MKSIKLKLRASLRKTIFAATIFAVLGMSSGCARKTIYLNDYLVNQPVGYSGYASIRNDFDMDLFERDVLALAKVKDSDIGGSFLLLERAESAVDGVWDVNENLANGDVIHYTWSVDRDALKDYNIVLDYKDVNLKVEGLEEVGTFDPFIDLKYTLDGRNHSATLRVENTRYPELVFQLDKKSELSNGDVVNVSLMKGCNVDRLIQNYGALPEDGSTSYIVQGLDGYMDSLTQLTTEVDGQIKKQLDDFITSAMAKTTEKKMLGYNVLGYYLLTSKDKNTYGDNNMLYIVYKHNFHTENSQGEENVSAYKYLKFDNVVVHGDGSVYVDLLNYSYPSGGWFSSEAFSTSITSYAGYKSLDLLYNKCVAANLEKYTVDSTVTEK